MTKQPFCVEENEKIENYDLAAKDNFESWHLHHRLQTHTADGDLREEFISRDELKNMNLLLLSSCLRVDLFTGFRAYKPSSLRC